MSIQRAIEFVKYLFKNNYIKQTISERYLSKNRYYKLWCECYQNDIKAIQHHHKTTIKKSVTAKVSQDLWNKRLSLWKTIFIC